MRTLTNILLVVRATVLQNQSPAEMNNLLWLTIGAIIALLLLVYLVIALVKPEKF